MGLSPQAGCHLQPAYKLVDTLGATEFGLPPQQPEQDLTVRHPSSWPKAKGPRLPAWRTGRAHARPHDSRSHNSERPGAGADYRGPSNCPPRPGVAHNPTYRTAPHSPALPASTMEHRLQPAPHLWARAWPWRSTALQHICLQKPGEPTLKQHQGGHTSPTQCQRRDCALHSWNGQGALITVT